jgi:hypothetical protein
MRRTTLGVKPLPQYESVTQDADEKESVCDHLAIIF